MANIRRFTSQAARRHGIPVGIFRSLVKNESGNDPEAVSPVGAQGLTQLLPGTASSLGVTDPFDPKQNLFGGAEYLRQQFDEFGTWELALAAYNAGPQAVRDHGGVPDFAETQAYVKKVLGGRSSSFAPPPKRATSVTFEKTGVSRQTQAKQAALENLLAIGSGQVFDPVEDLRKQASARVASLQLEGVEAGVTEIPTAAGGIPLRVTTGKGGKGGLVEAFHDPVGQFDNGTFSPEGIGGHGKHVHVSMTSPRLMLKAIRKARKLGLDPRENPYTETVDPVHTEGSFHYQVFEGKFDGKQLGKGLDVSDPNRNGKMPEYFEWLLTLPKG